MGQGETVGATYLSKQHIKYLRSAVEDDPRRPGGLTPRIWNAPNPDDPLATDIAYSRRLVEYRIGEDGRQRKQIVAVRRSTQSQGNAQRKQDMKNEWENPSGASLPLTGREKPLGGVPVNLQYVLIGVLLPRPRGRRGRFPDPAEISADQKTIDPFRFMQDREEFSSFMAATNHMADSLAEITERNDDVHTKLAFEEDKTIRECSYLLARMMNQFDPDPVDLVDAVRALSLDPKQWNDLVLDLSVPGQKLKPHQVVGIEGESEGEESDGDQPDDAH
ncbi:hypothetical protein DL765_007709 [Monosporascus sp. GIB2]|nr:hypothetical protein DL765_007709 [Monosporascus sp. GIB2]